MAPKRGKRAASGKALDEPPPKQLKKASAKDASTDVAPDSGPDAEGDMTASASVSTEKTRSRNAEQQKKRKDKLRGRTSPQEQDVAELSRLNEEFALFLSPLTEASDTLLSNTARLSTVLKGTSLINVTKPAIASQELTLGAALHLVPVAGRVINVTVGKEARSETWRFIYKEQTQTIPQILSNGKQMIYINWQEIASGDIDLAIAIAEGIRQILLAWPWPTLPSSTILRRAMFDLAFARISPRPLQISDCRESGDNYTIDLYYINPDSGELRSKIVTLSPTDSKMQTVNVPPLQDMTLLQGAAKTRIPVANGNFPYHAKPSGVKKHLPCSVQSQHRAQDALRYLSSRLTNIVATDSRFAELLEFWQSQIGINIVGAKKSGIYGGRPLYSINLKLPRSLIVRPSAYVLRDISPKKQISEVVIFVKSLDSSRVTPVLDTLLQNYAAGMDVRQTLIEAAKIADLVNLDIEEGNPASSACDCDEAHTGTVLHACEGCGKPAICRDRAFDRFGRLVCMTCFKQYRVKEGEPGRAGQTLAEYFVRGSLKSSFISECKAKEIDPDSPKQKKLLEDAMKSILEQIPKSKTGTAFIDAYTGKTEQITHEVPLIGSNPSRRRMTPTTATVDATFPRAPPGSLLRHVASNIAITSIACQYGKWRHLPGVLAEISKYLNIKKPTAADTKELLDKLKTLQTIRIKQKYKPKYQDAMREMVSGKLNPGEHGPFEKEAQRYLKNKVIPTTSGYIWDKETRTRLAKLAREIAAFFGKELPETWDGAPWPLADTPDDFSWNSIAMLCQQRLQRMKILCNKHWLTRDTPETLYAELIFQYCTDDPKYGDMFNLPLVCQIWHPTRVSFGHRYHGFGMDSGWTVLHPSSLSERDDSRNNMLVESWFSNCCKQDQDENYYPDLHDRLSDINMPKKFYNPDLGTTGVVDTSMAEMDEVEEEDVFAGQGFNEDAFGEEKDTSAVPDRWTNSDGSLRVGPSARDSRDVDTGVGEEGEGDPETDVFGANGRGDASEKDDVYDGVELDGGDDGEMQQLLDEARTRREEVLNNHGEAFKNDGRMVLLLARLQQHAAAGNRDEYQVASMELSEILYGE